MAWSHVRSWRPFRKGAPSIYGGVVRLAKRGEDGSEHCIVCILPEIVGYGPPPREVGGINA